MKQQEPTIAAISTAQAPAGISVIRISGGDAIAIADKVFRANQHTALSEMRGYTCALGAVYSGGEKLDECIATVFRAPHSYTGEDVAELSCHGGMVVTGAVLRAVYDAGAVPAEAGEFTKRAFLNGKLDLVEAESVMDIISARSRASARAALNIKDGALSRRIGEIKAALLDKAAHLNAWADYPEEDIPEVGGDELSRALHTALSQLNDVIRGYDNGRVLKDGIATAIVGRPNVGKSTLMNLLSGYDRSIVTAVAGTTRDVVEESVSLDDILLNLSDTAGIHATEDEVERIGVERAHAQIDRAALVLCVLDGSCPLTQDDRDIIRRIGDVTAIAVVNKADLPQQLDQDQLKEHFEHIIQMSAKDGDGLRALIDAIRRACSLKNLGAADTLIYNERQRSLALKAAEAVQDAIGALKAGMTYDAVTVSIEDAIGYLCELTGERVRDEVVDRVFHNFCVGK